MSRVVRFHRTGDAQVLQIDEVDVAAPEIGEVQIRVKALGIGTLIRLKRIGGAAIGTVASKPIFEPTPSRVEGSSLEPWDS